MSESAASSTAGAPPRQGWVSNATVAQAAGALRAASHVAILTHAKPDGDAVGSTVALARALSRIGVRATCVYPGPWFKTFDEFVGQTAALRLPEGPAALAPLAALAPSPDAVAIVDTGSWSQVADVRAWLEPRRAHAVVIDHHPAGDGEIADLRLIETTAAAAAEIVAQVTSALLGVAPAALPREIAEPLYLGIATDTGFFRYSNCTPRTLRLAADLIDAGADHNRVYQVAEQSDRPARLRVIGRALGGVALHAGDRVAVVTLSKRDLAETGADLEDAGGLTDLLLAVESVRACAVLTEIDGGVTKVSLRSKPPMRDGAVDVNAVARVFGGGGHVRAAGAKIKAPLADAASRIAEALTSALP